MRRSIRFIASCIFFTASYHAAAQQPWPVSAPLAEHMNNDSLLSFDKDISNGKYGFIDAMIITRNGKLIYQKLWKHNYDSIYGRSAGEKSALNAHDHYGKYNYYNPW